MVPWRYCRSTINAAVSVHTELPKFTVWLTEPDSTTIGGKDTGGKQLSFTAYLCRPLVRPAPGTAATPELEAVLAARRLPQGPLAKIEEALAALTLSVNGKEHKVKATA